MPWYAHEFEPLLAVAAAALNEDGTLIEANAGFRRIVQREGQDLRQDLRQDLGQDPVGTNAGRLFLQPRFAALVAAESGRDGEVYRGLLTLGEPMATPRTLRARVWRQASRLRVLAEYDIAELEGLNAKMLDLNRDYAGAQFQVAQSNLKLQQREASSVALSLTDTLTGLGNRRQFKQALATEISRATRTGETLCALMADLDHFKQINDRFGHEIGDKVLAAFGELLRRQTRTTEIVARIGGEEFVALMPHTDLADGLVIAERIRTATAALRIDPIDRAVTASFGVAKLEASELGDAFMRRVDKALYDAKDAGRNCVVAG